MALENNIIKSNSAGQGGGISLVQSSGGLTNTVLANNQSSSFGAGLLAERTTARLLHTTITGNYGGDGSGIHIRDDGLTLSSVMLTNTIVVSQTIGITITAGSEAMLESTLWYGNDMDWGGTGAISSHNNYEGHPSFTEDGYHLGYGSAATDKGVEAGITIDIDGDIRNIGLPDLGADEVQRHLFLPMIFQ